MASQNQATATRRRFLIVTPAYNAEAFIDDAIASVLMQPATGCTIHYHVQDGGSSDGTIDKLRAWESRLASGLLSTRATEIVFTFASEPDCGMYDALRRGFDRLQPRDDDILTWINSDDGFAQGSLVTVAQIFDDVRGCEFLSGRVAMLNEAGSLIVLGHAVPYARAALAEGLHDGRTLPFVMQEGTFFSGRVWNAVGGIDASFRLAGDWDLWRRMAKVVTHYLVDSITGFHRRRQGQLSADMIGYYREVDATDRTTPIATTPIETVGTIVSYDQAARRWAAISYDPSKLAISALLSDGRPKSAAYCQPKEGFGPPEGPYPQYGLPGGIRWINGNTATIVLVASSAGRYRIRLSLRAARSDIVIGLAINAREPQPTALQRPMPFVDQVVETIGWLEAGENGLVIDCGAPLHRQSILFIRCEATEDDNLVLRAPVLPPMPSGHADRSGLAIAILCDDDEPELLERTLAGCDDMVRDGAAVFIIRDPARETLDRVVQSRKELIANCFDIADVPWNDTRSFRHWLAESGYHDVLVLRRGDIALPRGVDAAIESLDDGGAGVVIGLVDERDSAGRALQLRDRRKASPALYRATGNPTAIRQIGCALAQTVTRVHEFSPAAPVIWLIDGDRPLFGRTPSALLAAALAVLGYDARHVVASISALPDMAASDMVVASKGLFDAVNKRATITFESGRLRLSEPGFGSIDFPIAIDTDVLAPRERGEARRRLGFAPEERIVCIAEASSAETAALIAKIDAAEEFTARILNFGPPPPPLTARCKTVSLDTLDDLMLLSFMLSAADVAITSSPVESIFTCAAWACGLLVQSPEGAMLWPGNGTGFMAISMPVQKRAADNAHRTREVLIATRSIAAFALAIEKECPSFRPAGAPASSLNLRSGLMPVRSYRKAGMAGWQDRLPGAGTLTIVSGATPFVAPGGARAVALNGQTAEIIACFDRARGSRWRLHVQGRPGDEWTICIDGRISLFRVSDEGVDTISLIGSEAPGPVRIKLERAAPLVENGAPLNILGLSLVGEQQDTTPRWEETAFELVPATAWPAEAIEQDGDWRRTDGFLTEQTPVPPEGLHNPFYWSLGHHCTIKIRVVNGGRRDLRLALCAGLHHQQIRPVVAGQTYEWCAPLAGPIGYIQYREWRIDWPVGEIDMTLEISDVLRAPGHDLGIMVFELTLADAPSASSQAA